MQTIVKRDGREVEFDYSKIGSAITRAGKETGEIYKSETILNLIRQVIEKAKQKTNKVTVEEMQDIIEKVLMDNGYTDTAKAYILYRDKRTRKREGKSELMDTVEEILQETHRENANVSNSPSAKMLQIASAASKNFYLSRTIPHQFSKAHREGDIHIHDLDFYGKTLTCLYIPLGRLLAEGFDNGHGFIRPPKRPASATALSAIILQSNQNDMHGGQAFAFFDRDMAPYMDNADNEEVYQAMEALVYNLNSMHSRAGAQVPFSSLNLGCDTTSAGRKVTRNFLKAFEAGLGRGENPIFPNVIFRLKEGINFNPGDPNYDLFQLAIRVASKRLNPTFSFMDASFNKQYGTEVSTMGCVDKDEVVVYRKGKSIYMESIKRLHERAKQEFTTKKDGATEYVDLTGYELFDVNRGFMPLHRTLKNPDKNDWSLVKLSNGRSIEVTSDHRWPVIEKGVLQTKDLSIGDKIQVTWKCQKTKDSNRKAISDEKGLKKSYLLGLLVTDGNWNENEVKCSLNKDDEYLSNKYIQYMKEVFNKDVYKSNLHDNRRGYIYQALGCNAKNLDSYLTNLFDGRLKQERHLPKQILFWSKIDRLYFLAGMVDGDGYINNNRGSKIQFHITNKEVALQIVGLAQSLGYPAQYWKKEKSYLVEFSAQKELVELLNSWRKDNFIEPANIEKPEIVEITDIIPLETEGNKESYCVTTDSSFMMCSFIQIGQCRTRVIANRHGETVSDGRGNLSFTTINLPRVALKSKDMKEFWQNLSDICELTFAQLYERYCYQANLLVKDMPFLMGQKLYMESENLGWFDEIGPAIKHGTLSPGFIGLAETLKILTGYHHGESRDAQKLGEEIVAFMKQKVDEAAEYYNLNYTLLATPAEGLSGRFIAIDREKYGIIKDVTDKEFYTNSFHVPVDYPISSAEKIAIEGTYHKYCSAGHISYVEMPQPPEYNPEAVEAIVRHMGNCDMGYAGINYPIDFCDDCGHQGVINEEGCPKCNSLNIKRVRRITGYLSTEDKFNDAKKAELRKRVNHS